jgi:hypothetical protein
MEDLRLYNNILDIQGTTSGGELSAQSILFPSNDGSGSSKRQRVLCSATAGYLAPKFEGKKTQIEEG